MHKLRIERQLATPRSLRVKQRLRRRICDAERSALIVRDGHALRKRKRPRQDGIERIRRVDSHIGDVDLAREVDGAWSDDARARRECAHRLGRRDRARFYGRATDQLGGVVNWQHDVVVDRLGKDVGQVLGGETLFRACSQA